MTPEAVMNLLLALIYLSFVYFAIGLTSYTVFKEKTLDPNFLEFQLIGFIFLWPFLVVYRFGVVLRKLKREQD